ncbi:MAG: GDSL-type esterase/lipase family protein [Melioribacteraceae bacterium]|nr:GDSL-type esterase/lipase family protein [Melioribacteraceae bacterium]
MNYKKLIAFIFLINIVIYNQIKPQTDSLRYLKNPLYLRTLEMYDSYKTKQADVIMLGNSLTNGANWNELLGRTNVLEMGIPSDILSGFLARIDYVFKFNPKIVFIMGGLNDIYNWTPVEEIFSLYVKLINKLKEKNITVVIQSTTYAARNWGKDYGGTPEINAGRNREVDKLNKLLSDFAKKNNIEFLDINSKLSRNGFLRDEVTWDGVHFKANAYKIWANEVDRILKKYKF